MENEQNLILEKSSNVIIPYPDFHLGKYGFWKRVKIWFIIRKIRKRDKKKVETFQSIDGKNFKTAHDLGVSKCVKCGFCCYYRPCIPTPEELIEIAKFLGLSVKEAIKKHFCVDTRDDEIFYVKPAGINQLDMLGCYIPCYRTFNEGKCVFLDDNNLCKIYPVRPNTAKMGKCWGEPIGRIPVEESWKPDKLCELYPEYKETVY